MTDRIINPHDQPDRLIRDRLGVRTGGQLDRRIDRAQRYPIRTTPVIRTRTVTWHRADIGASGDAAYLMRLAVPSSDSAWAMAALTWLVPAPMRLTGLELWSSAARSGGTATARVRVTTNGVLVDHDFPDCELNATTTQNAAMDRLWRNGLDIAKGATVQGRIVTAGTFGPNTADVTLVMTFGILDEV